MVGGVNGRGCVYIVVPDCPACIRRLHSEICQLQPGVWASGNRDHPGAVDLDRCQYPSLRRRTRFIHSELGSGTKIPERGGTTARAT